MGLFERIVDHIDKVSQVGFDFEKYNQISQKIDQELSEIVVSLQSDVTKENPKESLAKTWELLHAAFFLKIFTQPNPRHSLKEALTEFEPRIKSVDESKMNSLEKKSFLEFKRIIDIARRLIDTH